MVRSRSPYISGVVGHRSGYGSVSGIRSVVQAKRVKILDFFN